MAEPVYSCSLTDDELTARRQEWKALDERALLRSEAHGGGMFRLYRGGEKTASMLRTLIEAERRCCPFLDFSIDQRDDEVRLTVAFPPEAETSLVQIGIDSGQL